MPKAGVICQEIQVHAYQGRRDGLFQSQFRDKLQDDFKGTGPAPSREECLLYAGHAAVSLDGGRTLWGFNPDGGSLKAAGLINQLQNRQAFPGVVLDDTSAFRLARKHNVRIDVLRLFFPPPFFAEFEQRIQSEQSRSRYTYSFPNGEGDCNCLTWIERIGIPLFSGQMLEFMDSLKSVGYRDRRFGDCTVKP